MTEAEQTKLLTKFVLLPTTSLHQYIPPKQGINSSNAFKFLLALSDNPGITLTALKELFNSKSYNNNKSILYLLELGLIQSKKQPYWVAPLHVWRVNITYIISPKGQTNLSDIFRLFNQ